MESNTEAGQAETPGADLPAKPEIIRADSARMIARLFNFGNIFAFTPGLIVAPMILAGHLDRTEMIMYFIAMIVPPILWFGISIIIYIIARHHPNPRVGHYTQWAAYRFYGALGVVIPVGTFFGTNWNLWIITGGLVGLLVVPWSIYDLIRIQRESWQDSVFEEEQ